MRGTIVAIGLKAIKECEYQTIHRPIHDKIIRKRPIKVDICRQTVFVNENLFISSSGGQPGP